MSLDLARLQEIVSAKTHSTIPPRSPPAPPSSNDWKLEPSQTYERLLQDNSSLKTRVTELDAIIDFYRGTVNQYDRRNANGPPTPENHI